MDNWLPSSDDESAELELMRVKLQSWQRDKARKKRRRACLDGEEEDQCSDISESESNAAEEDRDKNTPKRIQQANSDEDSEDESSMSISEPRRSHGAPPDPEYATPPTPDFYRAAPAALHEVTSLQSNLPSSVGMTQFQHDASEMVKTETDGNDAGKSDSNSDAVFYELDHVDEAALVAAQQQAENEYKRMNGGEESSPLQIATPSPTSSLSQSLSGAESMSDWFSLERDAKDPGSPQTNMRSPIRHEQGKAQESESSMPDWHRRDAHRPFHRRDAHRSFHREATLEEEECVEAYLSREHDDTSYNAGELLHAKKNHPSEKQMSREPSKKTADVESQTVYPRYKGPTTVPGEPKVTESDFQGDDAWIYDLLRQQEREANGETSDCTEFLEPATPAVFGDKEISQAFGFESTQHATAQTSDAARPDTFQESQDEASGPLELPTREDADDTSTSDGIERDERFMEVDPSKCVMSQRRERPEPLVHHFTAQSHPPTQRRRLPVLNVFDKPQVARFLRSKFENFNTMQSELANTLAHSDDQVVVAAPTGAGKTALFEMAMARFFNIDLLDTNGTEQPIISKRRKIVYISPSKALCEERFKDWSTRLEETKLGVDISIVTGDGDPGESFREVASAQMILTTPEKLDSLTRRWTENFFLLASIKLVLVDEIHLLADTSRGSSLEAVLTRIKSIQRVAENSPTTYNDILTSSYINATPEAIMSPLRIVAVSATLPNISEIAEFLTANEAYVFDESFRPVPLTCHVVGLGNAGDKGFRFWNGLDREVPPLIHKFSEGRPTIVFCHSKAETERLADTLAKCHGIGKEGQNEIASKTRLAKLQRVLYSGVAYHHAGMEPDDRRLVEQSFANNKVRVLCTTTTLAMGVNLPARLVVVKGTKAWRGSNGYQDLDQASLLQMMGRAGRPGYDTAGTAVIMTESKSKAMFERMASSGLPPAKSQLLCTFEEIMNAEISQKVVTDMNSALNWIKETLYYVQLKRDPEAHCVRIVSAHSVDTHLMSILREAFRKLQQVGVLALRGGSTLKPFDACNIMSNHLVDYSTMAIMSRLPFDVTQKGMLHAICQVERLQRPAKRSEKKALNALHKDIRHKLDGPPSKVRVQKPWEKAFVLLQASIGRLAVDDYTLRNETSGMVDFASRMLSATEEFAARSSKNGQAAVQSLRLRRALATSLWCMRDGVLGQFSSLSDHTVAALKFNGILSFEDVLNATEASLEKAASRMPPFGSDLQSAVKRVVGASLKIQATVNYQEGTRAANFVQCLLKPIDTFSDAIAPVSSGSEGAAEVTYTLVAFTDRPNSCLLYKRAVAKPEDITFKCPPRFGKITIHLISSMVGLDDVLEINGNAEVYRTAEETAPTKSRAKKKGAKAGDPSQLPPNKIAKTQEMPRGLRQPRVTPSPPKPSNYYAKAATKKSPRQRDSFMTEYLTTKSAADRVPADASTPFLPVQQAGNQCKNSLAEVDDDLFQSTELTPQAFPSVRDPEASEPEQTYQPHNGSQYLDMETAEQAFTPSNLNHGELNQEFFKRRQNKHSARDDFPKLSSRAPPTPWEQASQRQGTVTSQRTQHQLPVPSQDVGSRPVEKSRFMSPPTSSTVWKQAKREQHRTQKHAFARNKENPFFNYQHDPNDSESFLDALSQKATPPQRHTPSSVIPPERQRAVDLAHQKAFGFSGPASTTRHLGNRSRQSGGPRRQQPRRRFFAQRPIQETPMMMNQQTTTARQMYGMSPPPVSQTPVHSQYFSTPPPRQYRTPSYLAHSGAPVSHDRPFVSPSQQSVGYASNSYGAPPQAAAFHPDHTAHSAHYSVELCPEQNFASGAGNYVQPNHQCGISPVPQQNDFSFHPNEGHYPQHGQSPYFSQLPVMEQTQRQHHTSYSQDPTAMGNWAGDFTQPSAPTHGVHGAFEDGGQKMTQFEEAFF